MDNSFGRPEDKGIEKEFMARIRGDKLQTINAECELEIELAFKEDKKTKIRNRSGKNQKQKESEEENTVKENQIQMLEIGQLDRERREKLTITFRRLKESWVFEELEEDKPLPDHFFDDGCDLSYILFNIIKEEGLTWRHFKAQQLIFLQLLCLEGRNHLNQTILNYYRSNISYIVDAMKVGLDKIEQKRQAEKLKSKGKDRKLFDTEHVSSIYETENQNNLVLDDNDQDVSKSARKKEGEKTKNIKKENKKVKGKKKSKKDKQEESSELENEQVSEQNQYPEGKQLALKTVNYISWAYWYIIDK